MFTKRHLYMVLLALCMLLTLPAFLFGFQLAIWTNQMVFIPVPAVLVCILMCILGYLIEESA